MKNDKKLVAVAVIAAAVCFVVLAIVNNAPEKAKYNIGCERKIAEGVEICR